MPMRWRWPPENSWGYFPEAEAGSPTCSSSSRTRVAGSKSIPWARSGSVRIVSTLCRGLRLASGSWKTICMFRRAERSPRP